MKSELVCLNRIALVIIAVVITLVLLPILRATPAGSDCSTSVIEQYGIGGTTPLRWRGFVPNDTCTGHSFELWPGVSAQSIAFLDAFLQIPTAGVPAGGGNSGSSAPSSKSSNSGSNSASSGGANSGSSTGVNKTSTITSNLVGSGTISAYTPGSDYIMFHTAWRTTPVKCYYTKSTVLVDPEGNTVEWTALRPDMPVTYTYVKEGDRILVTKVTLAARLAVEKREIETITTTMKP